MRKRSRFRRISCSLALTLLVAGNLGLAPKTYAAPEKTDVKLGYASNSGAFSSFWIAKEKGYFAEEGLNVELMYVATTVGLQALSRGDVDAMGTGCGEFFEANRKGYQNRIVANVSEDNVYALASGKDITKPQQLVGKSIAVNRIGDTSYLSVRYALRQLGVDPDKATYVQIGSTPERFSSLSSGAVAGAVMAASLQPLVLKNGFHMLINLHDMKIPSCLGSIGLGVQTIEKSPHMVEALLRAIVKGNAYLSAGPADDTKRIFSKYMKLPPDREQLVMAWNFYSNDGHSRYPIMKAEAARAIMDMMAEQDPSWKNENPDGYMDLRFMNQLKKSGYLDKVYSDIGEKAKK